MPVTGGEALRGPASATLVTGAGITQAAGYVRSQQVRKRMEEMFGWLRMVGGGGES